jgi:hypothetical protein
LREIDPREIIPQDGEEPAGTAALEQQLAGVEGELAEAEAFMEAEGFSLAIGKRVAVLEGRQAELKARLEEAKAKESQPLASAWKECHGLIDTLASAADPMDARLRLRAALRRTVEGIWLLVVPRFADRVAAVQVRFTGGEIRDYLIIHRPPRGNGNGKTPGRWCCASISSPSSDSVKEDEDLKWYAANGRGMLWGDLTESDSVATAEQYLKGLDGKRLLTRVPLSRDRIERMLSHGHDLPS